MRDNELWNKRALPALNEMYRESANIFGSTHAFTWDDFLKYTYKRSDGKRVIPLFAFFLPSKQYTEIQDKAVKGLRKYWRWPYRSEIIYSDDEIQRMQKELDQLKQTDSDNWYVHTLTDNIKYNETHKKHELQWERYQSERKALDLALEDGQITRKEYNKQRDKLCKSYDMTLRSADGEKIQFTLMDYSPNSSSENFELMKSLYEKLTEVLGTDKEQNIEVVKKAADQICNEDKAARFKEDLIYAYMFFSNFKNN